MEARDGFVALTASQVRPGDTVFVSDRECVCWGVDDASGLLELFLSTTSAEEFELLPSVLMDEDAPVLVSEYDAKVTGRVVTLDEV